MASFIPSTYYDDVRTAINNTVTMYMGKFAVIWGYCGYDDLNIQQRCEVVKQHVHDLFDEMVEKEQELTYNKDRTASETDIRIEQGSEHGESCNWL